MKNYYFKTDRIEYQNKILDTLDNALNDISSEDFDILIKRIQEYMYGWVDKEHCKEVKPIVYEFISGKDYDYLIPIKE